ncbi:MAG: hypothetical protein JXR83_18730 [Deltaproteobacteria bacterium]|nr:hypothetical protein [Deltaproteobacteria bacterium]
MKISARALIVGCASLAVISFGACSSCEPEILIHENPPAISVNVDVLDFGEVPLGAIVSRPITALNPGGELLTISSIGISGNNASAFAVTPAEGLVDASEELEIVVTFSPSRSIGVAAYSALLTIDSDASNSPSKTIELRAQSIADAVCADCNTPPSPRCLSSSQSLSYEPAGSCPGGDCRYQARVTSCGFGCDPDTGLCRPEPLDAGVDSGPVPDAAMRDAAVSDAAVSDLGSPDTAGLQCSIDIDVTCGTPYPGYPASYRIRVANADPGYVYFSAPDMPETVNYCTVDVGPLNTSVANGIISARYEIGTCVPQSHSTDNACSASRSYSCGGAFDCAAAGGSEALGYCWFLSPYVSPTGNCAALSCDQLCEHNGATCDLAGLQYVVNDRSRFLAVSAALGKPGNEADYTWIDNVEAANPYGVYDRVPPYAFYRSNLYDITPDCSIRQCVVGAQRFCPCH